MEAKVDEVHRILTNGHGLVSRVGKLEELSAEIRGSVAATGKTFRVIVSIVGVILVVIQIIGLIKGKLIP